MLTLEALPREFLRLPFLVRLGVICLVIAGLGDVVAHLGAAEAHVHEHTGSELSAHLAGFVSMVVIEIGVVVDGVRTRRARRHAADATRKGVA